LTDREPEEEEVVVVEKQCTAGLVESAVEAAD